MLHEESVLTSVFKLLNTLVLIGAAIYVFRTRILRQIYDAIAEKHAEEQARVEEKRALKAQQEALAQEIDRQRKECEKVKDHVSTWRHVIEQRQQVKAEEAQQRAHYHRERKQQQSRHLSRLQVQKAVMPYAVEHARERLEQEYGEKRQQEYMNNVMRALRKT